RSTQRIRQHLVENAVVAIEKERPRGVGGDPKARHAEHARQKERVVVEAGQLAGESERGIHPETKHQQVAERVQDIPEDERQIGGPDLGFAKENGFECARAHNCPPDFCVSSTKMSSRLAPLISIRSSRPRLASSETSSRTRVSS